MKYYSDRATTAHEVAAGPMTWLLVGSEDGNSAVLYSEKPMISANELKYPDTSDNTPTQGGTDSQFQPKYKNEGGNKYATTDETI